MIENIILWTPFDSLPSSTVRTMAMRMCWTSREDPSLSMICVKAGKIDYQRMLIPTASVRDTTSNLVEEFGSHGQPIDADVTLNETSRSPADLRNPSFMAGSVYNSL